MLKKAFLDIDTQNDFVIPEGKLYVDGAVKLIPGLARMAYFIGENNLKVLGSYDWHIEDDIEFAVFPKHCIRMTQGSMPVIDVDGDCPLYFEKATYDIFSNPDAEKALMETAMEYIVYGVALDICVKAAIEGLLERKKEVSLIVDLTEAVDKAKGHELVKEWQGKGVKMRFLEDVLKMDVDKLKEVV